MLCRIKADTSEPPCGVVAKKMRDEAMRSLMEGYGGDHRYSPDRRQMYCVTAHSLWFVVRSPTRRLELLQQVEVVTIGILKPDHTGAPRLVFWRTAERYACSP